MGDGDALGLFCDVCVTRSDIEELTVPLRVTDCDEESVPLGDGLAAAEKDEAPVPDVDDVADFEDIDDNDGESEALTLLLADRDCLPEADALPLPEMLVAMDWLRKGDSDARWDLVAAPDMEMDGDGDTEAEEQLFGVLLS